MRASCPTRRLATLALLAALAGAGPGVPVQARHDGRNCRAAVAAQAGATARVDASQLMADLRALASPEMEGRRTGTPGGRRAQAFILTRFDELSLEPVGSSHVHPFRLSGRRASDEVKGANLLGMIQGSTRPDRLVLVGAHYDHVGIRGGVVYPGADDNASGVAAMLAVAGWFARHPPERTLVFIAFDGEEQGLAGSRRLTLEPPFALDRVDVLVNIDMVGRGDDHTLVVAGTRYTPALKSIVAPAANGRALTVHFGHDGGNPREQDWTHLSDHGPFHDAGVPFLYFGVRDHADYHRSTDTADRIPRAFFVEAVEVVLDVVGRLTSATVLE
jgi:hypothetical protein